MARFKLKRNRLRKRLGELIFQAAENYRDNGYQNPDTRIEQEIIGLMRGGEQHSFRFHYDRPRRNGKGRVFHIVIPDLADKTRTDDDFAKEAMSHAVLYGCSQ